MKGNGLATGLNFVANNEKCYNNKNKAKQPKKPNPVN
jgi:hypothetical protein